MSYPIDKSTMGAIILAAGQNSRLNGIVPSYYKPFILHKGVPLIYTQVENSLTFIGNVTIVASPENVKFMCEILNDFIDDINIIIQPKPTGVLNAIELGMLLNDDDYRKVILCSDNIIQKDIYKYIAMSNFNKQFFFSRKYNRPDSERFTRFQYNTGYKGTFFYGEYSKYEKEAISDISWVGPLVIKKETFINKKFKSLTDYLNSLDYITPIEAGCEDIGTRESLSS